NPAGDDERGDRILAEDIKDAEHRELGDGPDEVPPADWKADCDQIAKRLAVKVGCQRINANRERTDTRKPAGTEPRGERCGDSHVREYRSECCAGNTPLETEDEYGVQSDVGECTGSTDLHRRVGIVCSDEDATTDEIQSREGDSERNDLEIP